MEPTTLAFLITLGAGLATGVGGFLAFSRFALNNRFLAIMLGLSAGVMIYVSLVEIFQKAVSELEIAFNDPSVGYLWATIGFFAGFLIIAVIDRLTDYFHNHDITETDLDTAVTQDEETERKEKKTMMRMGLFMAIAIAIHNFPEGLATFIATIKEPTLGIALAMAIAIHNIPEGIAVAIPIYRATKSRAKAFWAALLSGLAEPVGAVIGFFILGNFIDEFVFGVIFAGVAGMMIYVSLDQLLPTAKRHDPHLPIIGVFLGMLIMASSLVLFVA